MAQVYKSDISLTFNFAIVTKMASKIRLNIGTSFVDLLCFCSVLCLLCLCARLFNMCFVVTCWERADLLALVCGVWCEFVTFPLVSWVRCGT